MHIYVLRNYSTPSPNLYSSSSPPPPLTSTQLAHSLPHSQGQMQSTQGNSDICIIYTHTRYIHTIYIYDICICVCIYIPKPIYIHLNLYIYT